MMDEEVARNLEAQIQAELEEEERLARLKEEETNIALVAEWHNTQAMMDADCELAARVQEEEREELSIEEKSSYKHNQLKNKCFEEIHMLFNNTMKWIEAFVPMDTELNMVYFLLVEKMYPFTRNFLLQMWNDVRIQVDYEVEMAYDLLRLIRRQINEGYVPECSVWIHPPDKDKAFNQET
nr:hypothetical protein [Tanacetum cinerariifolium]